MSPEKVTFILCCDVDPDGRNVCDVSYETQKPKLSWDGVKKALPPLVDHLCALEKEHGVRLKVTWFVRSDDMMDRVYGDPCWPRVEFSELWDRLEDKGHELGWHPHLWCLDERKGSWYHETGDHDWIDKCLKDGFRAFKQCGFKEPACTRMGWDFMDNRIMGCLNGLGIQADLSSLPGMSYQGRECFDDKIIGYHDWEKGHDSVYHPSKDDYKNPGKDSLKIVEIPVTVVPPPIIKKHSSRLLGKYFAGIRDRIHGERIPFHLDVPTGLFEYMFDHQLERAKKDLKRPIVCYFHPSDLLVSGMMDTVKDNLKHAANALKESGGSGLTVKEYLNIIDHS